jgi:hypothetical protein
MNNDIAFALALQEMQRLAGERATNRWLHALGHRAAADDLQRRSEIQLAARLFAAGHSRAEVRQRLAARGLSRPTIDRRIGAALAQGPRRNEHADGHDAGIETRPIAT